MNYFTTFLMILTGLLFSFWGIPYVYKYFNMPLVVDIGNITSGAIFGTVITLIIVWARIKFNT